MPYRVSIAGIDGAGKSSVVSDLTHNLSCDFVVAKVGRPIYIESQKERRYLFSDLVGYLDRAHKFMDEFSSKAGILLANSLNVSLQPSLEARISREYSPDVIIASRDMALCPAVYLTYYFPVSKKISTDLRLRLFEVFRRLGYPEHLFYLDADPAIANERISARIKQEQKNHPTDRKKWRHLHENPVNLAELRKYYLEAIEIIKTRGVLVERISTTELNQPEVVDQVEKSIRSRLI